jgi:hypothetical protein
MYFIDLFGVMLSDFPQSSIKCVQNLRIPVV